MDALSRRRKPRREGGFQPIARRFRPVFHGAPSPSRRAIEPAARANLSDQKGARGGRWKVNRGRESPYTWAARALWSIVGIGRSIFTIEIYRFSGFPTQEKDPNDDPPPLPVGRVVPKRARARMSRYRALKGSEPRGARRGRCADGSSTTARRCASRSSSSVRVMASPRCPRCGPTPPCGIKATKATKARAYAFSLRLVSRARSLRPLPRRLTHVPDPPTYRAPATRPVAR